MLFRPVIDDGKVIGTLSLTYLMYGLFSFLGPVQSFVPPFPFFIMIIPLVGLYFFLTQPVHLLSFISLGLSIGPLGTIFYDTANVAITSYTAMFTAAVLYVSYILFQFISTKDNKKKAPFYVVFIILFITSIVMNFLPDDMIKMPYRNLGEIALGLLCGIYFLRSNEGANDEESRIWLIFFFIAWVNGLFYLSFIFA